MWLKRKKKNQVRILSSCGDLSIKRFFTIIETGDLKYLLFDINEKHDQKELIPIWEKILQEFQKLTGSFEYSLKLKKANSINRRINRLNGIICCYHLLRLKDKEAQERLKYWGYENSTLENIKIAILQERTKLNIDIIKNDVKNEPDKRSFEDMLIDVELALNPNGFVKLNPDEITVKEWVAICKSIEKRAKKISNGR